MARGLNRGEIWLYTFKSPDKRRPVLVLTRQEVIGLLNTVMVAPITSTIRSAPGEVIVDVKDGLKHKSAVNLDHIQTIDKSRLSKFVGTLSEGKMSAICKAISISTGCAVSKRPGK